MASRREHRRRALIIAGCVAAYAVLAVVAYLPASPLDAHRVPGAGTGDHTAAAWVLAWWQSALSHGTRLLHLQTNYVNYPNGANLGNNAAMPVLGLLLAPVTATLGPVASLNLLLRLSYVLSAAAMLFVLLQWCRRWYVAFIGGLIYGFSPYAVTQAGNHVQLSFIALPPLIVWCTYELVVVRRRRALRLGALLGLLAGAQALIDPEILVQLAIVLLVGFVGLAFVQRRDLLSAMRYLLTGVAAAVVVFALLTGDVLWWALFAPEHLRGTVQSAANLRLYRSDLLSPIFPTNVQAVAPSRWAARAAMYANGQTSEQQGYLGIPLILITLGLVAAWRRNAAVRASAALALVAFVLSLGTRLSVNAHVTSIPLPEAVLAHLPLIDNFVSARFALEVMLFLTIAVAIGADATLDWASTRTSGIRNAVSAGAAALTIMVLVSLAPALPFETGTIPWPSSVQTMLRTIPAGSVVMTYPYPVASLHDEAMLWQAEDGMRLRLVGSYMAVQQAPNEGSFYPSLLQPTSVQSYLTQLAFGGFSYWPYVQSSSASDLCQFIENYSVDAVLYWPGGAYPGAALAYFEQALGPPSRQDQGVRLWITAESRCSAPAPGPAG